MTDLLICIGNVGSYATLGPCLASIFAEAADAFDYTVAVGFNGFEDRAVIEQMRSEFPQVRWIFRPEKLGYTGIYNALMRGADARYVLVLDDDTLVPAGALPAMVGFMDEHPDVGLSGCRILNPDGSFQKSFNPFPDIWLEMAAIVLPVSLWPRRLYRDLPAWQPVDWMDGTFMLVRRAALDEVGDLDVFYFTYWSEADWALRMHRAGWQVAYVDTVSISHIGGEHSIKTHVRKYASIMRSAVNRFYFYRKHYGAGQRLLLRPAVAAGALVRAAKFAILWLIAPGRRIEAGPKARAFGRIVLLAFQPRPWVLPDYLQRENDTAAAGTAAAIDNAGAATPGRSSS
jgi:GT2 family glycosyltransferase